MPELAQTSLTPARRTHKCRQRLNSAFYLSPELKGPMAIVWVNKFVIDSGDSHLGRRPSSNLGALLGQIASRLCLSMVVCSVSQWSCVYLESSMRRMMSGREGAPAGPNSSAAPSCSTITHSTRFEVSSDRHR